MRFFLPFFTLLATIIAAASVPTFAATSPIAGIVSVAVDMDDCGIGISPVTGREESITCVLPGSFIKSPSFSTVYRVSADGGVREPFMDAATFFTYADSWDVIEPVTDATLRTLVLGAPVFPQSGTVLVAFASTTDVYALEAGEARTVLRKIPSSDMARRRIGEDWEAHILTLSPVFRDYAVFGEALEDDAVFNTASLRSVAELQSL